MVMPYNYNKQDENRKNGKAFTHSSNPTHKHVPLTGKKKINSKPDLVKLKLICEELPNHCVQFFFLS